MAQKDAIQLEHAHVWLQSIKSFICQDMQETWIFWFQMAYF